MKKRKKIGIATSAAATVILSQVPAFAGTSDPNSGTDAQTLQTVVVTANRVATSAQKTATAMNVYSGDDLIDNGVLNVQSLARIDPSVSFVANTGDAYVAVRGIASSDLTEIGDPAVPISRDGFYTNRAYSLQTAMYDVDRIEVLKGPQGTLNGRNSTGGLISIITNRPDASGAGGYATVGYGNYGAYHVEAASNFKLSDNVVMRASFMHDNHNGYRTITGLYTGQDEKADDSKVSSSRVQLVWSILPSVKFWASYQKDMLGGVGDVEQFQPLQQMPNIVSATKFINGAPSSINLDSSRARWELRADDLPMGLRALYSGGYDSSDWKHYTDGGPFIPGGYPAYENFIKNESPKTWNHEIRISNDPSARLFYQFGYFGFSETNRLSSGIYNIVMIGDYAPGGSQANLSQAGQYGIYFNYPSVKARSNAIFGYLTYSLTDAAKFSFGVRETKDEKSREGFAYLNLSALADPHIPASANPPPISGAGSVKESQPTYHIGFDWSPTRSNMVYAKFDTGYKSGGFNSNGAQAALPYDAEKVKTTEVGSKNRFMGNRLELNADVFYTRYTGYQGSQYNTALGGGAFGVFNVGGAKIYGAEFQTVALFGTGGRFDFNATLLHTAFDEGLTVANGNQELLNVGGNRLPNSPRLSLTSGIEQAFSVPGGTVTGRFDAKYSSEFNYSVFNTTDTRSPAYVTANFAVKYKPAAGDWRAEVYVRNLTNRVVFANAEENFTAGFNTYQFQPPRTFGVTGTITF